MAMLMVNNAHTKYTATRIILLVV